MVKRFGNYQYVPIEPMSKRDKQEEGSKFWNEGKWENFILPFIEESEGLTLVDMGSNAGLFLKLAEDMGFNAVGIEANREALDRAVEYKKQNGRNYKMHHALMEDSLDILPVSDYTILANIHYYLNKSDWLRYLDRLIGKTRYVILVTCEKERHREKLWKGSFYIPNLRETFKVWEEVGLIDDVSHDDPYPRNLKALCFKSPYMDRVDLDEIDPYIDDLGFYSDVDRGTNPLHTDFAKWLRKSTKRRKWSKERFNNYVYDKVATFNDIRKNGLREPIIINSENKICDGRNRHQMLKYLGKKSTIVRRVL